MPPFVFIENNHPTDILSEQVVWFGRRGLAAPGYKPVDVMPALTRKAVESIDTHARDMPDQPLFLPSSTTEIKFSNHSVTAQ